MRPDLAFALYIVFMFTLAIGLGSIHGALTLAVFLTFILSIAFAIAKSTPSAHEGI